jgi:hypothetical protein
MPTDETLARQLNRSRCLLIQGMLWSQQKYNRRYTYMLQLNR